MKGKRKPQPDASVSKVISSPDDDVSVRWTLFPGVQHTWSDAELRALAAADARGEPVKLSPLIAMTQFASHAECAAHMVRLAGMPRRDVPAMPTALPDWLVELADAEPVRVFDGEHDRLEFAGELRRRLKAEIERRASGLYTIPEAAALFARAGAARREAQEAHIHPEHFRLIDGAIDKRQLRVEHPAAAGATADPAEWPGASRGALLIRRGDLASWLAMPEQGGLRLPDEQSKEPSQPATMASADDCSDGDAPGSFPRPDSRKRQKAQYDRADAIALELQRIRNSSSTGERIGPISRSESSKLRKYLVDRGNMSIASFRRGITTLNKRLKERG